MLSYIPDVSLYVSIISPRKRLYLTLLLPYGHMGTCKLRNETRNEIYRNETKRNSPKRNEIYRSETKSMPNEINRNEIDRNETKRNGIIQNEIKPILTKQFLGEKQDKN